MTWQILEVEPAHAVCDQCKRHDCGIVDGQHKWVRTGIVDEYGDHIVIGHGCVNAWAENMGISREVVEREVLRPPTDEEIMAHIREHYLMPDFSAELFAEAVQREVDRRVNSIQPNDNPPAPVGVEAGQQTNQGTPSEKASGSGTSNDSGAPVREQRDVSTSKANRPRQHPEGTKDRARVRRQGNSTK